MMLMTMEKFQHLWIMLAPGVDHMQFLVVWCHSAGNFAGESEAHCPATALWLILLAVIFMNFLLIKGSYCRWVPRKKKQSYIGFLENGVLPPSEWSLGSWNVSGGLAPLGAIGHSGFSMSKGPCSNQKTCGAEWCCETMRQKMTGTQEKVEIGKILGKTLGKCRVQVILNWIDGFCCSEHSVTEETVACAVTVADWFRSNITKT